MKSTKRFSLDITVLKETGSVFLGCFGAVVSRVDRICHAMFRSPPHQDNAQAMNNVPCKRSCFPARYVMGKIVVPHEAGYIFEANVSAFSS